jgi:hypothetical protein
MANPGAAIVIVTTTAFGTAATAAQTIRIAIKKRQMRGLSVICAQPRTNMANFKN